MSLTDDILQLRIDFEVYIDNALSIVTLHENILQIAQSKLTATKESLLKLKVGGGTVNQINQNIKLLNNLENTSQILNQKEIIKEQVVVLLIGTLENYLGEIIKNIGNSQPELFNFKNSDERITFTQDMLKGGFKLGDAILEHILNKNYSFQDLQSSLKVFDDYLSINIELENQFKDSLILCAACRNIIVHNQSIINRQFMKQIRNTTYAHAFIQGDPLAIDDELIQSSKNAILEYADQLTAAVTDRDHAQY